MDRRNFIKVSSAAATMTLASDMAGIHEASSWQATKHPQSSPWYRRVSRWGQTNITEKDPPHYDIAWWRKHWKETAVQGIIANAGGIFAYYPTRIPYHVQAKYLEGRDLFGELCKAAHDDGLAVFARMDSNRAHEILYQAHPDWFAIDHDGKPYKAGELYITCVNGPYYEEQIPAIMTEIANLYKPEGFTDNSWSGLGRDSICYCENCRKRFKEASGHNIPEEADWNNKAYREWIRWNYRRRLEIWDLNNRTTKKAGGADCIWSGMNSGSLSWQAESFRDVNEICKRAEIIMMDSQARSDEGGFQHNADTGKLIHGVLGWDKLVPESMAMYQAGRPTFRMASKPVTEARMWMIEGIAGGIQPWWHYVGASHEDRRIYHTPGPVFQWHKANEQYLIDRQPVATVGVVWSQRNVDFYGRDDAEVLVELPWRGIIQALIRARIPYLPIHADNIDRDSEGLSLLILPNLGAVSDDQLAALKRFSQKGGGILATGESTLFDEWGDARADFGLASLFGSHVLSTAGTGPEKDHPAKFQETLHTYLRLTPELRRYAEGPAGDNEPDSSGKRHPVLKGFEETDIIEFGGNLANLRIDDSASVLMTFVPQFPIYPPETAWMREPKTSIPGLIVNEIAGKGRVVFMPADIDRQFGRYNLPDHGNLLANLIRWAASDNIPLSVDCHGLIDCNLYRKDHSLILHLVNLTSTATWRQPLDEYIPVGPVRVRIKKNNLPMKGEIRLLVAGKTIPIVISDDWFELTVESITDHEVVVIS